MPARTTPALLALLALLSAGVVRAQEGGTQPTYELDDSGAWVQTASPEAGTDAAALGEARRLIVEGNTSEAISILDAWLTEHGRATSPYVPEALLLRGDARVAADDEYSALVDYEAVTMYPESPYFVTALEREYEIALRYLNGLRRKFLGLRIEDATPTGEELLVRVQERLPGSRLAEQAAVELADFYYRRRDMPMASEMYEIFTRNFPQSAYRRWAMQRRIYASLARYKGPRHDTTGLNDARLLIQDFRDEYPQDAESAGINEALLTRVDESLGEKMLETARWYLTVNDEPSARLTLRRLLRDHPRSAAAVEALRIMEDRGWCRGPCRRRPRRLAPRRTCRPRRFPRGVSREARSAPRSRWRKPSGNGVCPARVRRTRVPDRSRDRLRWAGGARRLTFFGHAARLDRLRERPDAGLLLRHDV
jgi:outer membrane protein assembly factor BamD (BamD/ComL family)